MSSPPTKFQAADRAAVVAILSFVSPVTGLALEMIVAWKFGTSEVVDGFRVAWLITLLATQAIWQISPHVLVPLLASARARGGEGEGICMVAAVGSVYVLVSLG